MVSPIDYSMGNVPNPQTSFLSGIQQGAALNVMQQQQAFFKNIAVVGGLLTIAAWGAGAWSLDGNKRGA